MENTQLSAAERIEDVCFRLLDLAGPDSAVAPPEDMLEIVLGRLDDQALYGLTRALSPSEQRQLAELLRLPAKALPPVAGIGVVRERLLGRTDAAMVAARMLASIDEDRLRAAAEGVLGTAIRDCVDRSAELDALGQAASSISPRLGEGRLALACWALSLKIGRPSPLIALGFASDASPNLPGLQEADAADVLADFAAAAEAAFEIVRPFAEDWIDRLVPGSPDALAHQLAEISRVLRPLAAVSEALGSQAPNGATPGTDATKLSVDKLISAVGACVEAAVRVPGPALEASGPAGSAIEKLQAASLQSKPAAASLQAVADLLRVLDGNGSDVDVHEHSDRARAALDETAQLHPDVPTGAVITAVLRGHVWLADVKPGPGSSEVATLPAIDQRPDALTVNELPEVPASGASADPLQPDDLDAVANIVGDGSAESSASDSETEADPGPDTAIGAAQATEAVIGVLEQPDRNASAGAAEPGTPPIPAAGLLSAGVPTVDKPSPEDADGQPHLDASQRLIEVELRATADGRHALAAHAAQAQSNTTRAGAFAALALAREVRTGTGDCAAATARVLAGVRPGLADDRPAQLLALAAALRLAIYTPSNEVVETLATIRPSLASFDQLRGWVDVVLQVARAGINLSAEASGLRAAADIEAALESARRQAAEELRTGPLRTNKYTAATVVWSNWMRGSGLLGRLLTAAANDDREQLRDVRREVERLRIRSEVLTEINNEDRRVQKRKEITAGARDRLIDWSQHVLDIVSTWITVAEADVVANRGASAGGGLVERLKDLIRREGETVLAELASVDHPDILRACAFAASRSMAETMELMRTGTPPGHAEDQPSLVLNRVLLLAATPRVAADGELITMPSAKDLESVLEAEEHETGSWVRAYELRCARGDHEATRLVIQTLEQLDPELADRLSVRRNADVETARAQSSHALRRVGDELASARSHGHLNDADWSRLAGALEALSNKDREDFGLIADSLEEIRAALADARNSAFENVTLRLAELRELKKVDAGSDLRIQELASKGDFATADEYIALLRDGLELPAPPPERSRLDDWWPGVVEQLAKVSLDSRFVSAVKRGDQIGGLDFSRLDPLALDEAVDGLNAWIALSSDRQKLSRGMESVRPILRLLGIDASSLQGLSGLKKMSERSWFLLTGFRPTGRALVPDFGSQSSGAAAGNNAVVMVVWGTPRAATVASWVAEERSSRPVHIWFLGALDVPERVQLADKLRESKHRRPAVVIDDTVIAYLASTAARDYESTMRVTLPFAASNPYQAVGGATPPEMFYGRDAERQALRDMMGSALVYGGRQLGKSSLLRATRRDFDDGANRRAIYLDLRAEQIGGVRPPSEIWHLLWRTLADLGIVTGAVPTTQPRERLETATIAWLNGRSDRALLVLFDECDTFLESDAASRFDTVDALDAFMLKAERRIKFVFAGLHRVQRFQSVENQPLAHLGSPIAVGPLRSADAMKLVMRPVEALGYRFEHPELPARILAFCNNNPSLLVLFMQALVARLLDEKLQRPSVTRPPVTITDADVEATYTKESLADQIKERFDLTLELDPAYKVIAYCVAHEACEAGAGIELSVRHLRDSAVSWWPRGFVGMSSDGFRSLCDELVDLGVLARRNGNYGLRSPNILRFLGSSDQIAEVLVDAEHREPAGTFDATTARPRLNGDPNRRSPLSAAQLVDLVAARDQVRLVVGTRASGLDDALEAITAAAEGVASITTPDPATTRLTSFKNTTARHRIVVVDLRRVDSVRGRTLLQEAMDRHQADLGTTGIVFLADALSRTLLHQVLLDPQLERVNLVEIGRVGVQAWKHWVSDAEIIHNADELLELSGGWLALLAPAAAACTNTSVSATRSAALESLRELAVDKSRAESFVTSVGLRRELAESFRAMYNEFPEGAEPELLTIAAQIKIGDERAAAADVELLKMIGALIPSGETLVPEPLLVKAVDLQEE